MRTQRAESRPHGRRGFTLIELIAALALSGLALAGSARLLDQLAAARDRSAAAAATDARRANGVWLLRTLAYRAEAPSGSAHFSGADSEVSFRSLCEVPEGWLEHCDVTLRVVEERDGAAAVATVHGASLTLWRGATPAALRYFTGITAAGGGQWMRGWGTSIAAPAAIGIVSGPDTIVLRLGSGT